jgi:hypothetical protein
MSEQGTTPAAAPSGDSPVAGVHEFRGSWRWPEDVERFVAEKLPDDGETLHVPCGQSQLGDVRVDRDSRHHPDVVADMFELPFGPARFDAVVSDPPWKSVNYFDRWAQFFELLRVTKPGGLVVFNATWEPWSREIGEVRRYRRTDGAFTEVSQITVCRRYPNQVPLTEFGRGSERM